MTSTITRPPGRATGRPPIDPRIQARRIEVLRDRGRKRRKRLIALIVVLLLLAAAAAATQSSLLDVDHIRTAGGVHTSPAALAKAGSLRTGEAMLEVDPGAVRSRVERLPWVDHASVRRQWPGTVTIRITERRPVAVVDGPSGLTLVDPTGRLLGPATGADNNLVHLDGRSDLRPGATLGAAWQTGLEVAVALPPALRLQVAAIGPLGAGDRLTLRDGIEVRLCGTAQLADKAVALDALLRAGDRTAIASINLCVPGAPALTPRPKGA
ncbi:MAG: Polypeptide-transport-associated domain protein FtsQ-type [Acidimicrobiales bacterium]|nr:Polypeptide-transport-associated domain protein FtsQ-type [Acidimicrobiales bacterium]